MIHVVRQLWQEQKHTVREDEVFDRLSFNIWKTRNRVLEELLAERRIRGETLPVPSEKSIWWDPKMQTRMFLSRHLVAGVLEKKNVSELTKDEMAWASRSESAADEDEARFKKLHDRGELTFYRLVGGGSKKKDDKDELEHQHVIPVLIK